VVYYFSANKPFVLTFLLVQNNGFCKCDHTTTIHCEITTGDICVISSVHTCFQIHYQSERQQCMQAHTTVKCFINYIHQVFNQYISYLSFMYLWLQLQLQLFTKYFSHWTSQLIHQIGKPVLQMLRLCTRIVQFLCYFFDKLCCIQTGQWVIQTEKGLTIFNTISTVHPLVPKSLLTYLLTYSMEQSPSWEANWFEASQKIPRVLWNPKVHYRTHKCPPPVPILRQPNPVHTPTSHFPKIRLNIILPSTPGSPQW
jgi:hypothetical protein